MRVACFLLLLSACGPLDFNGRYSGTLDLTGSCDDGSTGNLTGPVKWLVVDTDGKLAVTPTGGILECGPLSATVRDRYVADVTSKTCPLRNSSGLVVSDTLKSGGTLKLDGDKLRINLSISTIVTRSADGKTYRCSNTALGALVRMAD